MITIEPVGGLGNRMRAVESCRSIASRAGVPLRVVWTRTSDLCCRFDALFEPIPGATVVERSRWANRLLRRAALWTGRYSRDLRQPDVERLYVAERRDPREIARERSALVVTCSRLCPLEGRYESFVPRPAVREAIERLVAAFGPRTVGVHLRRSDYGQWIERSPTAAFVERMDAALAADPRTTFFLSTDAPAEEAALRARYPGRIVSQEGKDPGRASPEGIRGAVVDLYALSRTAWILGSFASSFSETAAEIGGSDLVVVDRPGAPAAVARG